MSIADINRRIDNLIRYGIIAQTDFDSDKVQPRVRVKTGGMLTDWIPIAAARANQDAEHDPVQVGEHVILLSPSGELAQAVVIGKLFSENFPSPDRNPDNHRRTYRDGAVFEYNSKTNHLNVALPSGGTVNITALGGFTLNGDITHNGNLQQNGKQIVTGDVIAGGISQINRVHGGVQGGPSSTGKPS